VPEPHQHDAAPLHYFQKVIYAKHTGNEETHFDVTGTQSVLAKIFLTGESFRQFISPLKSGMSRKYKSLSTVKVL
jgi:hypothetical protein